MNKYKCLIDLRARIMFSKNITIGKGSIIGRCDIIAQGKISIGSGCLINDYVILNSKTGYIKIGSNTSINNFAIIYGNGGVEIGSDCAIAHSVKIIKNHEIPVIDNPYGPATDKFTRIGDFVWIGANVVIIDGVSVGNNAVIGANSFVNKDLTENAVYAGNPAKLIKTRS
jgi:acetyltransferase-like isoleucine patch superfamily enzyme